MSAPTTVSSGIHRAGPGSLSAHRISPSYNVPIKSLSLDRSQTGFGPTWYFLVGNLVPHPPYSCELRTTFRWKLCMYQIIDRDTLDPRRVENFQVQRRHLLTKFNNDGCVPGQGITCPFYAVDVFAVVFANPSLLEVLCWHFSAACRRSVPRPSIWGVVLGPHVNLLNHDALYLTLHWRCIDAVWSVQSCDSHSSKFASSIADLCVISISWRSLNGLIQVRWGSEDRRTASAYLSLDSVIPMYYIVLSTTHLGHESAFDWGAWL